MADADEGGSSHPNVVSGRELGLRKRSAADDIIEESDGSSSSDDKVEDETYRMEYRAGKGPIQQDNSEDPEDEEEESEDDDDEEVVMHLSLPSQDIPLVVHQQTTLGMG